MRRLWFVALILMMAAPVLAQTERLMLNTEVTGTLAAGESAAYTLRGVAGEVVSLHAVGDGGLDPTLRLTSGGTLIAANDDYSYPATTDALLEAVTLPTTGEFTVTIGAFGATAGGYTLGVWRGYAAPNTNTQLADFTALDDAATAEASEAGVTLTLAEAGATGVAANRAATPLADFYAHVRVTVSNARAGWQAGLNVRQQSLQTYYALQVNELGQWRFVRQDAGTATPLRNWNTHPAIVPGDTEFDLGVLANGASFDLFYNGSLLGQATDTGTSLARGVIGVGAVTPNQPGAQLTATFDSLTITEPLAAALPDYAPQQLTRDTPTGLARQLERQHVIPPGGTLSLTIGESTVSSARGGVARQSLGRGVRYTNMVVGTTLTTSGQRGDAVGCGLVLRATDDTNYVLAYLDETGGYGLATRVGEGFAPGLYAENPALADGEHTLMVVANDARLLLYVDGTLAGDLAGTAAEGQLGAAVVNFVESSHTCTLRDTWVWTW